MLTKQFLKDKAVVLRRGQGGASCNIKKDGWGKSLKFVDKRYGGSSLQRNKEHADQG